MAGFNYHLGMSNNAVAAYRDGRKPLSKITARDLEKAGWDGTLKDAKALAKMGFWETSEWHHSGGAFYNKVDFYDPEDLVLAWDEATAEERSALIVNLKQEKKTTIDLGVRVAGHYAVFDGSQRNRRFSGNESFTGVLVGKWIFIDGGGKKRADGNHIEFRRI